MRISERGLNLIKRFEGLRLHAYRCPAGVWTIGYGHTRTAKPDARISPERAQELLHEDLAQLELGVDDCAGLCTHSQFDAFVSFAYNLGLEALRSSTLLKLHKLGQHKLAAAEFTRWVHANGRRLPGLVRRRAAEAQLYLGDLHA